MKVQWQVSTVRHEWLGQYLFRTIEEVKDTATEWLWTYNHERHNMALGLDAQPFTIEVVQK